MFKKDKEKARADDDLDRQKTERTPCKCFRYKSVDNIIYKCTKPPKGDKKIMKDSQFQSKG